LETGDENTESNDERDTHIVDLEDSNNTKRDTHRDLSPEQELFSSEVSERDR